MQLSTISPVPPGTLGKQEIPTVPLVLQPSVAVCVCGLVELTVCVCVCVCVVCVVFMLFILLLWNQLPRICDVAPTFMYMYMYMYKYILDGTHTHTHISHRRSVTMSRSWE